MPTGLFDNNAYLAVERKLGKRTSVQVDAGYMLNKKGSFGFEQDKSKPNFNIKGEYRYYLGKFGYPIKGIALQKWYVAFQLLYKQSFFYETQYVCYEWKEDTLNSLFNCVNGENNDFNIIRKVFSFNGKLLGRQWVFKNRIILDAYAGVGVRFIFVQIQNKKEGVSNPSPKAESKGFLTTKDIDEYGTFPNLVLGFKIGYIF